MFSTLSTQACPVHAHFEVDCMICTAGISFPVDLDTQMRGTSDLATSIYPRLDTPAMASAYRMPKANIQAPVAKILSPNPVRTNLRINIITNSWCDPRVLEDVHDFYPERFALSPEERLQMLAGKHSFDYMALSPVRAGRLSPVQEKEIPQIILGDPVESDEEEPVRVCRVRNTKSTNRDSLPPKKNHSWRGGGRPTKMRRDILNQAQPASWDRRTTLAGINPSQKAVPKTAESLSSSSDDDAVLTQSTGPHSAVPLRAKRNEGATPQERTTKHRERVRRRSQRARREPSPESSDLSELSEDEEGTVIRSKARKQTAQTHPARRSRRSRSPVNYSE